jgi:rare lipoprotein A
MLFRMLFFFLACAMSKEAFAQVDSLFIQEGIASYYAHKFQGRRTASGEPFHQDSLTAAHKILPFGTTLKVTNQKNGKTVWVRVNDRLPSNSKRSIDLSYAAAQQINMIREGLVKVNIDASDIYQMNQLAEFFEKIPHPGLRIRPYFIPIAAYRSTRMFTLSPMTLGGLVLEKRN